MPIEIGEINSTVVVDDTRGSDAAGSTASTDLPAPLDQQRWQAQAERQRWLAQRTAAWGFDD
jgi:hypothetical protein